MSNDPSDYERDAGIEEMYREFSESALDDPELCDRIVDSFKESHLHDFYFSHPAVLQPAREALDEAKALLHEHPRVALVLAVAAADVGLRKALLEPILHGCFHDEASADLVVRMLVGIKSQGTIKAFLTILKKHTGVDILSDIRPGARVSVWQEMCAASESRNVVVHQAGQVSTEEASQAIGIADFLLGDLFRRAVQRLGLHMHGEIRVCGSPKCENAGNR